MGLSNYKENKGFSSDMYVKVRKPNGEEVLDEISLKKSTKVNFLNSGAGSFEEWDPDIPDEINQNVYRAKARKRNMDYINANKDKVNQLLNSPLRSDVLNKKFLGSQSLSGSKEGFTTSLIN